jgi:exodeoxyribonuclease III
MKIATWNVNGIRARETQALAWIEKERPEVICLQEIKATAEQVPLTLRELRGYRSFWHGSKGYSGVALLISRELCPEETAFTHPPFDFETRVVAAVVNGVTIASVYVPNGGRNFAAKMRFLSALEEYAAAFAASGDGLILCGDLNIARADNDVHPAERRPVICQLPAERRQLERILHAGLLDVARELHPEDERLFTWWAPWRRMRERNIGWRLDYLLASPSLAARATSCAVQREVGTSDHAPVVATFALPA